MTCHRIKYWQHWLLAIQNIVPSGVENLLRHGHCRIAYIGGDPTVYTGMERLASYRDAFAAHGVSYDDTMILLGRHDIVQAERFL